MGYMDTSTNRDSQLLSRIVLKGFTGNALGESVLVAVGITFLLAELLWDVGWVGDDGLLGEFKKTMGDLQNGYSIITDPPMCKRE